MLDVFMGSQHRRDLSGPEQVVVALSTLNLDAPQDPEVEELLEKRLERCLGGLFRRPRPEGQGFLEQLFCPESGNQ